MSKILTVVFSIIMFLFPLNASSEGQKSDETTKKLVLERNNNHDSVTNRPKAPSRIVLECYYSSGHLRFTVPADAEYLYITIGDEDASVWTGMVTREYPETDIPMLIGEYEITCRTDGNQIFGGVLNF